LRSIALSEKKAENINNSSNSGEISRAILTDRAREFMSKIFDHKCKKCESIKPPKAHHCSTCKRCVAKMDHHCPWINNCVGANNQKHFLLFLVYTFIGSAYSLTVLVSNNYRCLLSLQCSKFDSTLAIVLVIVNLFLSTLFLLFTLVMFCDQMSCILDDTGSKFGYLSYSD
jgi:hypothetical protein